MTITQRKSFKTSWENCFSLLEKIGGTKTGKILAKQWSGKIALILAGTVATVTPAHALKINATYSSEIDLETKQVIEDTLDIWEDKLRDPVTLKINFAFDNTLPTGILGGSKPAMVKVNYKHYLTALTQDALSTDDQTTIKATLANSSSRTQFNNYMLLGSSSTQRRDLKVEDIDSFDMLINPEFNTGDLSNITTPGGPTSAFDNNDNSNNQTIWLSRANAKALRLINSDNLSTTSDDSPLDASIVFSNTVNWDKDSSDGVSADAYDLRTVILHEVGHALGFVGGPDAIEYKKQSSSDPLTDNDLNYVTPMNTYTYSSQSRTFGVIDMRLGQGIVKYISLDGGKNRLGNEENVPAYLSTGSVQEGGDGYQTSHWKNGSSLGIMAPTLDMGESLSISELDLTLLDVTGWDLIDRSRQLIDEVGLNWDTYQQDLETNHQNTLDIAAADWESVNSGDSIREELDAELWDLYQDIDLDIEQELLNLKDYLATESDLGQRQLERDNTLNRIWQLIAQQDQKLQQLSHDEKNVKVKVRDWLDLDVTNLSNVLQDANRVEFRKLQKTLEQGTEAERLVWEDHLRDALALFLDNPDQALAQINATNDFHNPMDGGSGGSGSGGGDWGGWWTSSVQNAQDLDFYNYTTTSSTPNAVEPAQSVPEPSAIIALVALGGMGFLTRKGQK
ncbi:MAG: NF038122 family metalloprotease [Crocosphaera sp.]|nr:NF038122 family metalloprotease [Crocosphaera sp.]